MARRIELPSSDDLFAEGTPYSGPGLGSGDLTARRATAGRRPRRSEPGPRARSPVPSAAPALTAAPASPHRRPGIGVRISRAERRLRELPIDSLLELRAGLETLLIRGGVTEAEVSDLLGVVPLN